MNKTYCLLVFKELLRNLRIKTTLVKTEHKIHIFLNILDKVNSQIHRGNNSWMSGSRQSGIISENETNLSSFFFIKYNF